MRVAGQYARARLAHPHRLAFSQELPLAASPPGGGSRAPARAGEVAAGAGALLDAEAAVREGQQCAELGAALGAVQVQLEVAGREVARLRQREATLESAMRRDGLLRAPPGGAPWEFATLS